jgi:hypothetical protein
MNKNINEEISRTLAVTDNLKQTEMPDFFYTRLKARMEHQLIAKPKLAWVFKPIFVVPTLAMVMLLNVITVSQLVQNKNNLTAEQYLAKEYSLDTTYGIEIY